MVMFMDRLLYFLFGDYPFQRSWT